jgi:uncharacterized protein YxjI
MGVFSRFHRYREVGEQANVNNVSRYGAPEYSLFASVKVFTLHQHTDILDNDGNIVYYADSKVISLHDKTKIFKASGELVAYMHRILISLHERHYVTMSDGSQFELSNELFHIYKDITNIYGLGWELRGNMFGLNFQLYDTDGSVIAVIGQKFISLHDKYCIDIYKREYEEKVVAILITLQHMIRDRKSAACGGGGSSGGGGGG